MSRRKATNVIFERISRSFSDTGPLTTRSPRVPGRSIDRIITDGISFKCYGERKRGETGRHETDFPTVTNAERTVYEFPVSRVHMILTSEVAYSCNYSRIHVYSRVRVFRSFDIYLKLIISLKHFNLIIK